jgi:hypothetical protein
MKRYRKHFPLDERWAENEANPIAKICCGWFGLEHGSIMSAIIVFPVVLSLTYCASQREYVLGFITGIYYFVFILHIQAQRSLTKRIRRWKEREMEKPQVQVTQEEKSVPKGTHTPTKPNNSNKNSG